MIGPFPWDPFPPGEPDPKGPDPVPNLAFRAAVTAADAYRSVRLAFRRENGTLRVGNRFVSEGRYREIAFVAAGHAAASMALAALHVAGERLTQGFVAGPEPVPPEVPFRGATFAPGWGGAPEAAGVVDAASEIARELSEQDLLLVLLSPGALRAFALPPSGWTGEEFGRALEEAHRAGATSREVGLLARVHGSGAVGGRLLDAAERCDVATLVVERGDGPTIVGGGPTRPVSAGERTEAAAIVARLDLAATWERAGDSGTLASGGARPSASRSVERPVAIASPADALRAAADALFEKGWTSRLAFLALRDRPGAAADRFLARSEELIVAEQLTTESRTKGLCSFAMTTLDLPEGVDEGPALGEFLDRARRDVRRREMSVGLFRTAGPLGSPEYPAGAVVGQPTDPEAAARTARARAVRMRRGVTDVGLLAVGVYPVPVAAGARGRTGR